MPRKVSWRGDIKHRFEGGEGVSYAVIGEEGPRNRIRKSIPAKEMKSGIGQ